jgi:hypothetical protein
MEISLAKPLNDKRKQAQVKREQRSQFDPPLHSRGGLGNHSQGRNNSRPSSGGFRNQSQRGGAARNRPDDSFS